MKDFWNNPCRVYSRHWGHGYVFRAHFLKKGHFGCLNPPKQMPFLTVSNENIFSKTQGTRLGVIVAPNKGLEWTVPWQNYSHIFCPAGIYLLNINNRNIRPRCEISSKLTIKTLERCQWRHSGVFIINFEHISHLGLVFLLPTLSRWMPAGCPYREWLKWHRLTLSFWMVSETLRYL